MATLVLAKTFLQRFAALSSTVQKDVQRLLEKFDELSRSPTLHLEPIKGSVDPNVRTIRVNQSVRGVVAAPEKGDTFILIDVLPHDAAINWCLRRRLSVNQCTGALEICEVTQSVEAPPPPTRQGFFASRSDADLEAVGIDRLFLPSVRAVMTEEDAVAFAERLPGEQGRALAMLAAGYSVDDAIAELLADQPDPAVSEETGAALGFPRFDPADVAAAALRPASGGAFYVVESAAALAEALNQPLAHWRVFLHPAQRSLAYKRRFGGPARVLGGPGTGKTVVALHRAWYLAQRVPAGHKALLTTFTRGLAQALSRQLVQLAGGEQALLSSIEVINIDALTNRLVRAAKGGAPRIVSHADLSALLGHGAERFAPEFSGEFLRQEWEQVILAQGITSQGEYLAAPRTGRGVRLDRGRRAKVWAAVAFIEEELGLRGEHTHLQVVRDALAHVRRTGPIFPHAVVDEAQDLHPLQWRLVRALVAEGQDDLFIAGDAHQRIYDQRVSLGSLGIAVRGRGAKLRLNYRTTAENLGWALGVQGGCSTDDLDGAEVDLSGYRSELHGPVPVVQGYASRAEELQGLAAAIREWMAAGVAAAEIGIAARTAKERTATAQALAAAGVPVREVTGAGENEAIGGVHLGTMHGLKGLEYRCLAVVGVSEGTVPLSAALTSVEQDPLQHARDLERERALLFVACTRARDWLRVSWSGAPSRFLEAVVGA